MPAFNVYWVVIGVSLIIIFSYGFNALARKTNIPSVLMLIVTGFVLSLFINLGNELTEPLKILGTVGLIMIVLEAALDLHLDREKAGLITRSFFIALALLALTSFAIAMVLRFFYDISSFTAMVYAIPIAIMSSAIIIPSVANLTEGKKEFLVFESAFSDIAGIMFFNFLLDSAKFSGAAEISVNVAGNILLTLLIAIVFGYIIIILIQQIDAEVKLFLPIATLLLLYAVGQLFHLSSLIFILAFGLMINNHKLFFRGPLRAYILPKAFHTLLSELKLITLETSFLIRTFFFIVFGMSITLDGFNTASVFLIALLALAFIYLLRFIALKVVTPKQLEPALYIAPRGLITILLFYKIPPELNIPGFSEGTLLLVILVSSLVMMYGLIKNKSQLAKAEEEAPTDVSLAAGPILDDFSTHLDSEE
ncbi:MAG: cation:proton antiporter [Cyclobacteriaceae bacterium]